MARSVGAAPYAVRTVTSRRHSSCIGMSSGVAGGGGAKNTNVAPGSRHASACVIAGGAPVASSTRSARQPSLTSRTQVGQAVARLVRVERVRRAGAHRPVEAVGVHVGRDDAARAEGGRQPDVEQARDPAADDEHGRAGAHARAHLRAHDAPERLDERALVVRDRRRAARRTPRSVWSAGTRTYSAKPPGSTLVVCSVSHAVSNPPRQWRHVLHGT